MNFEQFRNYAWGMYGNNTISRAWELYKQSQHALWMARADKYKERALRFKDRAQMYFNWSCEDGFEYKQEAKCDRIVELCKKLERKCREKAKEFE